jgi:tetratricopeptide (TPR) repeat protein
MLLSNLEADYQSMILSKKGHALVEYYKQMAQPGYETNKKTRARDAFSGFDLRPYRLELRPILKRHGVRSVLDYGSGGSNWHTGGFDPDTGESAVGFFNLDAVVCYEPARSIDERQKVDCVISFDVLEHIYVADVPAVLRDIFSCATRLVILNIACYSAASELPNGENTHVTVREPDWWKGMLDSISVEFPHVGVFLICSTGWRKSQHYSEWRVKDWNENPGFLVHGEKFNQHSVQADNDNDFSEARNRHTSGDLDGAASYYLAVLRRSPDHFGANYHLGQIHLSTGDHHRALEYLQKAEAHVPEHAALDNNLGAAFFGLNRFEEAGAAFSTALAGGLNLTDVWQNAAMGLMRQGLQKLSPNEDLYLPQLSQLESAAAYCHKVLGESPDSVQVLLLLGVIQSARLMYAGAALCFNKVLELQPDFVDAIVLLASVQASQAQYQDSLDNYTRAIALKPDHPASHSARGRLLLKLGELTAGWPEYEWRNLEDQSLLASGVDRKPRWQGQSLEGKTLLVLPEQGLGDFVMFASCIDDLCKKASHVILVCEHRLQSLLVRSFPSLTTRTTDQGQFKIDESEYDYYCTLGSLPVYLRLAEADFARKSAAYLVPDAAMRRHWLARYAELPSKRLNIGVCWRGGSDVEKQALRSVDYEFWMPMLSLSANFINLQSGKHHQQEGIAESNGETILYSWPDTDAVADIEDYVAQIAALDLVISVDCTTVHLAGALGIDCWVLLPGENSEWRWMLDRTDSHWYQTLRLFRGIRDETKDRFMSRVQQSLASHIRESTRA